jgi:hypothetical protein
MVSLKKIRDESLKTHIIRLERKGRDVKIREGCCECPDTSRGDTYGDIKDIGWILSGCIVQGHKVQGHYEYTFFYRSTSIYSLLKRGNWACERAG